MAELAAQPSEGLRSSRFRQERERSWIELERMIGQAEKNGLASLTEGEIRRLPVLYRSTMSSLSVARAISLDRALITYLDDLCVRSYFVVYGVRRTVGGLVAGFLTTDLPRAVRVLAWHILAMTALLAFGAAVGYWLASTEPAWFEAMVPLELAQGRTPGASAESLERSLGFEGDLGSEGQIFAAYLFSHNTNVSLMAFGLGLAGGLPTLYLVLMNGLTLGAMFSVFAGAGLGIEFAGWLSIHGTTELLAIVMFAAGGLRIGQAVLFPGRYTRLASLSIHGRVAGRVALGGILMLAFAALLEAFARQGITDTAVRFAIGGTMLVLWVGYFALAGRGRD